MLVFSSTIALVVVVGIVLVLAATASVGGIALLPSIKRWQEAKQLKQLERDAARERIRAERIHQEKLEEERLDKIIDKFLQE